MNKLASNDRSSLILANLDTEKYGLYKPNIETFYDGVDVMTNFSRSSFLMREDVINFVGGIKKKYENIILLGKPNDKWTFKVLAESAQDSTAA